MFCCPFKTQNKYICTHINEADEVKPFIYCLCTVLCKFMTNLNEMKLEATEGTDEG